MYIRRMAAFLHQYSCSYSLLLMLLTFVIALYQSSRLRTAPDSRIVASAKIAFAGLELLAQAAEPLVGTWELNVGKSTFKTGPRLKSSTRKFEAVPNGLKYSGQSVNTDGTTSATQWSAYFDGKDYPIKGDPNSDTISLKRIDRFNTEGTFKKAGKVVSHLTRNVSQDGKIWTLTVEGTDAQGKPFAYVLVFDKK